LLWQRDFGGPTSVQNLFPEIAITPENDVVAVGQIFQETNHPVTGFLGWVTKVSNTGEKEWTVIDTSYAELGPRTNFLNGITIAPSGTIYAAGYTQEYVAPGRLCGWILKVTPDGCVDTLCFTTSTGDIESQKHEIHVFPNPFSSTITLELPAGIHGSILEVSDLSGCVLYTKDVDASTSPINVDLSALPSGLLIYTLRDDNGGVHTGKVVKVE
ncbi:MAG: T9SS type A sorting domain-containing protein, partial [Saprospiraceae bacterium]|nr:T9SS type A sorting domain-containing protein [Saprospiraceae bacterium]